MFDLENIMAADEFDYEFLKLRDSLNEEINSQDDVDSDDMESECDGENILSLVPENPDYEQLFEDIGMMIDDYVRENIGRFSNPAFHDELTGYIFEQLRIVMFASVGETHAVDSERAHYLMHRMIETGMKYYFTTLHECDGVRFSPWRSEEADNDDDNDINNEYIGVNGKTCGNIITPDLVLKVRALQAIQNQTEQRTDAWYARRHSLITASAAWKAFGTESVVNQLIYEKCKPYVAAPDDGFVNVDSPLHWGQKYEFLSAQLYQLKNNTRIGEFGCIQHPDPKLSFIGGSPDGINIDESSRLFGRMVEIKNIVNRDITGIPKEEYWIQMQIQMAVCGMEECDFVETRFKEYDDAQDYYDDVQIDYVYATVEHDWNDFGCERGIILYFADLQTRKPHYEYMPMEYRDVETQEAWVSNTIAKFDKSPSQSEYIWIRNIYWKLDQYSCVLVRRNHSWFNDYAAPRLECVWRIIEKERITGYDHRAPKKRTVIMNNSNSNINESKCAIIL
jgi:hypothetical protein